MSKTYVKRGILVALLFLLVSLFAFAVNSFVSNGENLNRENKLNYFVSYARFKEDDKFEVGYMIGIDLFTYTNDQVQLKVFENALNEEFKKVLDLEKQYVTDLSTEQALPEESVKFSELKVDFAENKIIYSLTFNSFETYRKYYKDIKYQIDEKAFVSMAKMDISADCFYSREVFPVSRKSAYLNAIFTACQGLDFENKLISDYKPILMFEVITGNARAYSNCQNVYYGEDNLFHHSWKLDKLSSADTLKLRLRIINGGWWYFIALVIPLCVMVVVIIATVISDKKKRAIRRMKR